MNSIGKWIKHFFVPHEGNEYRPHVLRDVWVLIFLFITIATFAGGLLHREVVTRSNFLAAIYSATLVDLANADRGQNNVGVLVVNPVLERAAQMKADDMAAKGYFAHWSPDGKAPWDWIKLAGYTYAVAGENLAIDFTDSTDVNDAWMNSPGHRTNLLNNRFTEIGIATAEGVYQGKETTYVVEMFGRPGVPIVNPPISEIAMAPTAPAAPIATKQASSSESVKGAETEVAAAPIKAPAKESFLMTENASATPATTESVGDSKPQSRLQRWRDLVMSNPSYLLETIYAILAIIIFAGLCGFATIELEKHHYKHVAYGFLMLSIIFSLGYVYKAAIFTSAVVAGVSF
jgi:hypothetical protein